VLGYATESEKMTQNLEDLRVRRTRKLLQKALLDAASDKGFAQVTVRDITERAMVNRATFYRHYEDKYDLLRQYLEELAGMIDSQSEASLVENGLDMSADSLPAGLVNLYRHIQANREFYRVMLGNQGDPAFCAQSFRGFIERGLRRMLSSQTPQTDPGRPPVDLIVSYLLNAGIGAMIWWLEEEQPCSPEQMAVWLYQLSMASIDVSLGKA
jgi:AcrR family transcriptional regulator